MTLSRFETRVAEVVARALIPRGTLGGATDAADVAELFREECRTSPWYAAMLLRISLWLAWFAPLWILRRFSTMGGLAQADRERVIEALLKSRFYQVRLALMYLKVTTCALLLGDERVLARIGAYRLREPTRLRALGNGP